MSLRKISDRYQVALPGSIVKNCGCNIGDYVDIIYKAGLIILKPVAIVDKEQEYFYTKQWQDKVSRSEEDYKKGRYKAFKDAESLIKSLRHEKD